MIPTPLRGLVFATGLVLTLTGCPRKTEGGLLLKVSIDSSVRAECLVVDATSGGSRVSRSVVPRQSGKSEYFIGIARGDFPATLSWQATAYQGRCADETAWKLSSRSEEKSQSFPATGVTEFELVVGQPDMTLDGDRDTWVDRQKGGADCDDTNAQVNPGATQVCGSTTDTNCDGRLFCSDPTCANELACNRPAMGLVFDTPPASVVAADCSGEVALQSIAAGMPAPVSVDTMVTLAPTGTSATGLQLFSDVACTTPLTTSTLLLRFGVNRATFSFRAAAPGSLTLTASATGLGSTTFTATITDRPVTRLAVNPVSLSAQAGACSTAVDVIAQDDRMMPTNVGANSLPLAVTYRPPGTNTVRTYTDPTCTTEGVPSIAAGTSTARLYLRGTRATPTGMPITVEVSSPGVNMGMPATLPFTVTAGAPDHLEFVTTVLGLLNNDCGLMPAEVELFDANDNLTVAGPGGVDVSLAVMPPGGGGTLQFFASTGCGGNPLTTLTVPAGQARAGVYLRAMGPGTYRVTATASTLPDPARSLQVDVATMPPSALVFPASATTITTTANVCSPPVRLQTREQNSLTSPVSPVPAMTTVTLSPSAAGFVTLFSDSSCTTPLTSNQLTINSGFSEVSFHFRSTRAASFTLTASATNLTTTAPPQPARVNPGPTSKLVFDPPTTVSTTAGVCGPPLVLRSFDAFDNPTSASGPITPAASPVVALPAGVAFSAAATCTPASPTVAMSDGGVTFFATAQRAQPYTLTATGISTSSTNTITFGVDAGTGTALRVVTQPLAALGAGACTTVTLERVDAFMNPSPGAALPFAVAVNTTGVLSVHGDTASCMSGTPGAALSFGAGETRATFSVRGRLVGTSTLTATATGHTPVTTSGVTVSAGAAELLRFATNNPPVSSPVGACTTVTVERVDGEGNLATTPAGQMVSATASGPGSLGGMLMAEGATCGSTAQTMVTLTFAGSSRTFSYSPRALGALNFVVSGGPGVTSAMGSTTVGAGAVGRVNFVNPPTTDQPWGGCTALELEALDVGNNRVTTPTSVMLSSASGAFYTASDCSGGTTTSATIPASSTVIVGFRPQPAALGMVTVTATPPMPATAGSASFNVVAGTEVALQRTNFPSAMTSADGCVDFTVRRVDGGGNATGGALRIVTITLSGAASVAPNEAQLYVGTGCMGTELSNPGAVNLAAMASTATFSVKPRKVGALTVAVSSTPLVAPLDTSTTVVGGALTTLAFVTTPPASLAANLCSQAVTVSGADQYGNPTAIGTQALTMANGTFFAMPGCTGPITDLAAGTATSASFYLRNSTPDPMAGLRVGTPPLAATQNWNIIVSSATALRWKQGAAPPATLARFTCSSAFRVEVTDGVAPIQTPTARVLSFAPAATTGFRFFTDPTCTTEVTGAFQINAMQTESPDLYAYAVVNGTFNAVATDTSGSPLTPTPAASVVVSGGPAAALTVSPGTTDLLFKTCTPVTILRQVGGTDFTRYDTTVNVTVGGSPPAGSYTLHTTSNCSDSGAATLPGRTIAAGNATTLVYLKGLSADPASSTATDSAATARTMTITATDPSSVFSAGTSAAISIHPAVRRGTCTIENNETSSSTSANPCTIVPPLPASARSTSFYTFQAVAQNGPNTPDSASTVCTIDAMATALVCQRTGTSQEVRVTFQVVTMGAGLQVNHFSGNAGGSSGTVAVDISAAGLSSTTGAFLLFGYQNSGTTFSFDDGVTAELASATQVDLKAAPMAAWSTTVNYSLQVVQLAGVTVDRGVSTSLTPAVAAPPASTTSVLLHTQRVENPSTAPANETAICKYRLRGVLTSDTQLTFSRGVGTMGNCVNLAFDGISWERLAVPNTLAAVQEFAGVTINGNTTTSSTQDIGTQTHPLDRTWSFVGGQGPGGQAGGETNVSSDDVLGYTQARVVYSRTASNTRITLTRGAQGGGNDSTFGLFVLTFAQ
ncbi:MAG: putative metal-binding motif-containing protein [Myxococcaceae bacterium]|nr:putative metal-binding motif-containing protein [Myxococcaceae bacterium]